MRKFHSKARLVWLQLSLIGAALPLTSCRGTSFGGESPSRDPVVPTPAAGATTPGQPQPAAPGAPAATVTPPTVLPTQKLCSNNYAVGATSNPYLAGVADGTAIKYTLGAGDSGSDTDTAPAQSPVYVAQVGNCLTAGNVLYFSVGGTATYANGIAPSDANGNINTITRHQKGALYGKANIVAPFNSLVGLFLTDADPTNATAPATLDFSTAASRDYATLAPQVGQIFYIGNGKTSGGAYHKVTVPQGATRLYFATMDTYQWNNNSGGYTGAVLTDAAP